MSTLDDLRRVPLFGDLSEGDLVRFADVTREREYPRNSVILFEDDPGDSLYIVSTGQVKVVLIGEDGREVILSVLNDGDFFGEMSLIDDEPRSAHVIAMKDSRLLVLRRDDFQQQINQHPSIAVKLLKVLVQRLRRADAKIGGLVLLDVNGRVAKLLLDLADESGGPRITRKLTHHTIAQMIGSSRETVSRAMRELSDRGLVDVTRREITIKNRDGLAALAGDRA
jgi:CRP/FNR family cyclic AMP-dependent transcriptional regulator